MTLMQFDRVIWRKRMTCSEKKWLLETDEKSLSLLATHSKAVTKTTSRTPVAEDAAHVGLLSNLNKAIWCRYE